MCLHSFELLRQRVRRHPQFFCKDFLRITFQIEHFKRFNQIIGVFRQCFSKLCPNFFFACFRLFICFVCVIIVGQQIDDIAVNSVIALTNKDNPKEYCYLLLCSRGYRKIPGTYYDAGHRILLANNEVNRWQYESIRICVDEKGIYYISW